MTEADPGTDPTAVAAERPKALSGPTKRVAEILECLGSNESLRLSDIANRLGQAKSTTLSVLTTLAAYGFVVRDRHDCYSLGIRLFAVASGAARGLGFGSEAHQVLEELSQELKMTVNVAVLSDEKIVYVDKVQDYSSAIQLVTFVGGSLPAHATAMGKVLGAELPEAEREQWISRQSYQRLTTKTLTTHTQLREALDFYRSNRYAVDDEESHYGVVCIAAPVFDQTGRAIAAVSATAITTHMDSLGRDYVAQRVLDAARRLNKLQLR